MISVYEFVKHVTNCKAGFTNPVKTRKDMQFFSFENFKNKVIFYRSFRVTTKLVTVATLLGFWPRLPRWRSWYWRNWSRMRRRHFGFSERAKSGTNIFETSSQSSRTTTQNLYESYLLVEIKVNIVFVSLAIVCKKKSKSNETLLYCFQHSRIFELLPTQVTIKYLREKKKIYML